MAQEIADILALQIGGNGVQGYAIAALVFAVSIIVLKLFESVVVKRLKSVAAKTKSDLDNKLHE